MKVTKEVVEKIKDLAIKNYREHRPQTSQEHLLAESYLLAVQSVLGSEFGLKMDIEWPLVDETDSEIGHEEEAVKG